MMIGSLKAKNLLPMEARTSGSSSGALDISDLVLDTEQTLALIEIAATSGSSPTLDVTMKESADQVEWSNIGSFAQQTSTGVSLFGFNTKEPYIKADYEISGSSGSGGFTFSINVLGIGKRT